MNSSSPETGLEPGEYRLPDGREKLKAHNVRHLCACKICGGMADDRETVFETHPKCYFEEFGGKTVLSLEAEDRGKFRLCDIPAALVKQLLELGDD